jgi:hypothetical protein
LSLKLTSTANTIAQDSTIFSPGFGRMLSPIHSGCKKDGYDARR